MNTRDKIFVGVGSLLAISGIISTLFWAPETGIISILLLGMLLLILAVLERRQTAKLQTRVLNLVNAENARKRRGLSQGLDGASWKKVLGLLQAQQISMEILAQQVHDLSDNEDDQEA